MFYYVCLYRDDIMKNSKWASSILLLAYWEPSELNKILPAFLL